MTKKPIYLAEICKECASIQCKKKIYTFIPLDKDRVFCPRYVTP